MTVLDPIKPGELQQEGAAAGGMSKFAVMAGLAINLAGAMPAAAGAGETELSPAEHFAQTWGDCVDE